MRLGGIAWATALCGLPFSPFFFAPLDPWHAQATWAQGWILGLWCYGNFSNRHGLISHPRWTSRPVFAWLAWALLSTWYWWWQMIKNVNGYPIGMLQGVIHALIIIMAVQAFILMLVSYDIEKITLAFSYIAFILCIYAVCQMFSLDQFFKSLDTPAGRDELVGTMGNPTHFGSQLSLMLPFVWHNRRHSLLLKLTIPLMIGIVFATGSTTALGACLIVMCFLLWRSHRRASIALIGAGVIGVILLLIFNPSHWLGFQGRLTAWQNYWKIFVDSNRQITGLGLGWVMDYSRSRPEMFLQGGAYWRHVHNEWFQMLMELGVVGAGLFIWIAVDWAKRWFRIRKNQLVWTLGAVMLVGFLNSLTNFTLHLWGIGIFVLVAYAGTMILEREIDGAHHIS